MWQAVALPLPVRLNSCALYKIPRRALYGFLRDPIDGNSQLCVRFVYVGRYSMGVVYRVSWYTPIVGVVSTIHTP